jgi:hypothetical protein
VLRRTRQATPNHGLRKSVFEGERTALIEEGRIIDQGRAAGLRGRASETAPGRQPPLARPNSLFESIRLGQRRRRRRARKAAPATMTKLAKPRSVSGDGAIELTAKPAVGIRKNAREVRYRM